MLLLALLALPVAPPPAAAQADGGRPIVIELFTSQGCTSCPPADALLGELAAQAGILALSVHVDYWDYLGWKDPFALRINTDRQRAYARAMSLRYVYTPQIVIEGCLETVGSKRHAVAALIARARAEARTDTTLTLDAAAGEPRVVIAAGVPSGGFASVWQVLFDSRHETEIKRGENSGRTLVYRNVVRDMRAIGTWRGEALILPLALDDDIPGLHLAVLLQSGDTGRIVGVATGDRAALQPAPR